MDIILDSGDFSYMKIEEDSLDLFLEERGVYIIFVFVFFVGFYGIVGIFLVIK